MKIWEAIIYGVLGGVTELLPISFSGHATVFRGVFNLSPLNEGGGLYIRVGICLGIIFAIFLSFRMEARAAGREISSMLFHRNRRRRRTNPLRRSILMGGIVLIPMLFSLIFMAWAERITRLLFVALFFAINGTVIYFCSRGKAGARNERDLVLPEAAIIGFSRMLSVFPGMSSVGTSLSVGHVSNFSTYFNLRFCFLVTLVFQGISLLYHLIRAFAYGAFSGGIFLGMLVAMSFAAIFGYLAIQYLKYLVHKNKLHVFAYYCWDAVAIVLIVSLINA